MAKIRENFNSEVTLRIMKHLLLDYYNIYKDCNGLCSAQSAVLKLTIHGVVPHEMIKINLKMITFCVQSKLYLNITVKVTRKMELIEI